jgi:hypothetical protein
MKTINLFISSVVVLFSLFVAFDARSENNNQLPLDSLLGKYEGRMQIHNAWQQENDYQTEIVSVDKSANIISLVAQCQKCPTREWKRNNCAITEAQKNIKFICKTKFGDEEYVFNGEHLKATGFGTKYPYTISVKKVIK